ncbi:MAG: hydroxyacid dehydrogenase [Ardenticatenaceae bacterium]|nr:hydroxyacid dehydrogenase [Ardenticatenaceae bacterium]MCB8990896.1 hydroxyacid dehydrogenase [Ardenticatenaceae bacterium]MCB9004963.1 hydroxyacid dehydrogenase [Ardenticatenaceae bacterium]
MLHVHILDLPDGEGLEILQRHLLPGIAVTAGDVIETAVPHILVGGRPSRAQLAANPQLHTLIIPWAGLPGSTRTLLADFPHISVHNLHHNAAPVAELTLSLLLAAARFIVPFDQALRRGDWRPRYNRPGPSVLLAGKTALVLGYGAIGQRVARLCRALDMRVLATRRSQSTPEEDGVATIYPAAALLDLLPQSHALLICLPLTTQTEGLIGAAELASLARPSLLINIGRGLIVDEGALYTALQSGELHAAGLDVWYNYPSDEASRAATLPGNYPFHELPNVVLSPHRGGGSDETAVLRMTQLADLLNAAVRGEPLPNRVDIARGY